MAIKYYNSASLIVLFASFLLAPSPRQDHIGLVASCAESEPKESINGDKEPPFPLLFTADTVQAAAGLRIAKIVTEIIGENIKTTVEEYLDLELRRAAYVTASTNLSPLGPQIRFPDPQQQIILSHSHHGQIFIYKPYSCIALPMFSNQLFGIENWSVSLNFEFEDRARGIYRDVHKTILRIFGVAAIWAYAATMPKKYALTGTVYSTQKDVYKVGHQWTVANELDRLQFKLSFIANNQAVKPGDKVDMSLETVQISSLDTGAVLRTFNVLSVERELDQSAYTSVLEVPVGFGCRVAPAQETPGQAEQFKREMELFSKNFWSSSKVDLEVSGTKIDPVKGTHLSDTIYVEMVHALDRLNGVEHKLSMVVVKSSSSEVKTISNYAFNVRYTIDMQTSTCTMSHLPDEISRPKDEQYYYMESPASELLLKFSNGLKLSLETEQMEYLLFNSDNYAVVKETETELSSGEVLTYTYLERTIDSWPYGTTKSSSNSSKFARQVVTVVKRAQLKESNETNGSEPDSEPQLHSVTLWVFANSQPMGERSTIIESVYHINVINYETGLRRWPDVPRLFDVGHECYLQSDHMHSGQDYAWIEFFYPLSSRQLDILEAHESRLARDIHDELTFDSKLLTSFQVPELELMFSDEGLTVRALLLDLPSLHLMYEPFERLAIDLDKERGGDLMLITPDIGHCSKLCQQYSCKSMTFCSNARSCLLGMRPVFEAANRAPDASGRQKRLQSMQPNAGCTTYSANGAGAGRVESSFPSLASVLARMKHYDYDTEGMPRPPDDVLSLHDWQEILDNHRRELREYFANKGVHQMVLFQLLDQQLFTLIPTSVLIEDDPFEKFGANIVGAGLSGGGDDDDDEALHDSNQIVDSFHEGLSMSRYKIQAIVAGHKDRARTILGVTYDQCAIGCLDSKCGTFSYCPNRQECILTAFNLIAEASRDNLIEQDGECFISQRNFASNFQKYPNTRRPLSSLASSSAHSISDCALACMLNDGYTACASFDYCPKTSGSQQELKRDDYNCYLQTDRHPEHIFNDQTPNATKSISGDKLGGGGGEADQLCDHYERSYLAEFNRIESAQFSRDLLDKLDFMVKLRGKTTLECADICLNQLDDCSAFQFCLRFPPYSTAANDDGGDNYMQECLMIRDKLPAASNNLGERNELELVIDPSEHNSESLIKKNNKLLEHKNNCQVFALRPNTARGHVHDLALGNTMTIGQKSEFERRRVIETAAPVGGHQTSWATLALIFMGAAIVASQISLSFCWAYQRNEAVRHHIDRFGFRLRC